MSLILLVDDEPDLTQALRFTLESRGFQCIVANNMTDGMTALQENQVNVLVTDIMMPAGERFPAVDISETGFHFIEVALRAFPRMPIVCLSVIADSEKIKLLNRRGIRYLRKGETPLSTAVEVITSAATGRKARI